MKPIDMGFGNSVCVREAFLDQYKPQIYTKSDLLLYNYPKYEGDPELIKMTKQVIKRQTGQDYEYVIITNGATGAISLVLGEYNDDGHTVCLTRNPPYYTKYPRMVSKSGLIHAVISQYQKNPIDSSNCVALLDYPSNPKGLLTLLDTKDIKTVVDGVYLNRVYMPNKFSNLNIKHEILVGSYSKLLGLNGIRLGWIATNDKEQYENLRRRAEVEYCGLATPAQDMVKDAIRTLDWDQFEKSAKYKLDCNREEWSKLEKYFGNTAVSEIGMFYFSPMDRSCKDLLEKAGIIWTKGEALDCGENFGRVSLGNANEITKEAVDRILKIDRK